MAAFTRMFGVLVALVGLLGVAGVASAQSFYYSDGSYAPYSMYDQVAYTGTCVNISRDLSQGMRGSDVSSLQQFLVSRNYPGSGNWMITGYYGAATAAAVRNFQSAQGLAVSGIVDAQTRLALDRVACGGGTSAYQPPVQLPAPAYTTPSYVTPTYTYPSTPTLPYYSPNYGYGFGCDGYQGYTGLYYGVGTYYANCGQQYDANIAQLGAPTITYLSPVSGAVGESVTIFGTGFSTTGNTVHFGNGVITNLGSQDGRSVSFTVPNKLTGYGSATISLGAYYVSVTNAAGYTSNTAQFTITSLGSQGAPVISDVSGPTSLAAGTVGTWTLTTNSPSGSYLTAAVDWGDAQNQYGQAVQQAVGYGAQTLSFTHTYSQQGTYTIQFKLTNANGQSTVASRTVTVSGTSSNGSVSLSSITPSSGRIGTQIAIQGSGFSQYDNTVRFGSGGTMHLPSYNGTTIYYTVPQYLSPCDITTSGACALYLQLVTPGTTYPVSVSNSNGTSNAITFSVIQ